MKKGIFKKVVVLMSTMVLGGLLLVGCGSDSGQKIVIAGSSSVQPLSDELAIAYMEKTGTTVEVQGGGSGQAISALADGIADIGSLSREVKEDEKSVIKKEYVIARDGIALIANDDVTVDNLTLEQIRKIFSGEITNWKDVGGKDAKIVVVSREEGSGTRTAFAEITKVIDRDNTGREVDNTSKDSIIQPSTGGVKETVTQTPNAIGYASMEAVDTKVKTIKVEGVKITGDSVSNGSYKLSRPFIYAVGATETEATKAFIEWVLSNDGQNLISKNGFIPVNLGK